MTEDVVGKLAATLRKREPDLRAKAMQPVHDQHRLIFVPPPDQPARSEIVKIMADGKPVTGLDPMGLAKRTKDFSGADIKAMFDQAVEAALTEAMKSGKVVPVTQKQLARTAKQVKPSTRKWFESAKNYALYANQSGFYDDVLDYLGIQK